jgi:hypothetical protein
MTARPTCKDAPLTDLNHEWVWVAFTGWECERCHATATEKALTAAIHQAAGI